MLQLRSDLLKNRTGSRQCLVQDFLRELAYLPASARRYVKDARLVASNYSFDIDSRNRDGKADSACKLAPGCNGQDDGKLGCRIEFRRRDNHNRPVPALFMARSRVVETPCKCPRGSYQLTANAGGINPLPLLRRQWPGVIGFGKQLRKSVVWARFWIDNQPSTFHRNSYRSTGPEL